MSPAVARNHDGRLELFAVGLDEAVWHSWQTAPNKGWSRWQTLDNPGVAPSGPLGLRLQEDGRLVLLMATTDGGLWRRSQEKAGAGPWEPWEPLDIPPGGLRLGAGARTVGAHQDGRLVLAMSYKPAPTPTSNWQAVWLVEQTVPNGGWAARSLGHHPTPELIEGYFGAVLRIASSAMVAGGDGRLTLAFVTPGTAWLYRLVQEHPNSGTWGQGFTNLNMDEWA
jgi:hypothetical protein